MKKQVFLLRHAQTAGKQAGQQDYHRELTPEGERQINNLAMLMVKASLLPEFILSSSSTRTRHTVQIIQKALQLRVSEVLFLNSLYEGPPALWTQQLQLLPNALNTVLLVGHNPSISHLASTFAGKSIDLPVCGFIAFEFPAMEWKDFHVAGTKFTQILSTP